MNDASSREMATRWRVTSVACMVVLLASWCLQSRPISLHLILFPKTAMFLPGDISQPMWLPALTGIVFILLSRRVLRGAFNVTRTINILLIVLALLLGIGFLGQLIGIRREAYRIYWPATITSIVAEVVVITALLSAYLGTRRNPSLASRTWLNGLLSVYVVNVWCGSHISLIGP